jgi:DNA (cytosine-5)-methyltransferase 1
MGHADRAPSDAHAEARSPRDAVGEPGCRSCLAPVDLIAGGFPCQPFSNAGKRQGKDDIRWLWPEFARVIGDLRPRYVLVENVPGLLAGHGGMGAVLGDLATLGYDAEWDSIPASAVGAPHLRYRVWIVATRRLLAHADSIGSGRQTPLGSSSLTGSRPQGAGAKPHGAGDGAMADADDEGSQGYGRLGSQWDGSGELAPWSGGGADDGWWLTEPDVGRVAHGVPARVDRLRALGNAVVPQVVEWIGRQILTSQRTIEGS